MLARTPPRLAAGFRPGSHGRRILSVCIGLATLLPVSCGAPDQLAQDAPLPSSSEPVDTPSPLSSSPGFTAGNWQAKAVAYTTHVWDGVPTDLWLYDVQQDEARRLTTNGNLREEMLPHLLSPSKLFFAAVTHRPKTPGDHSRTSLYELNIESGEEHQLRAIDGFVSAAGWSPDERRLAYLVRDSFDDPEHVALRVYDRIAGTDAELRRVADFDGREGFDDDETSLAWSPDGNSLLVSDTWSAFRVSVIRVSDGSDVVLPRSGTQARWSATGDAVFYREFGGACERVNSWRSLDIATGEKDPLAISPETFRPNRSPDGRQLVHYGRDGYRGCDSIPEDRTLYVYDTERRVETKVSTGLWYDPIWLTPTTIAATEGRDMYKDDGEWRGCSRLEACIDHGPVWAVNLNNGSKRKLALHTTMWFWFAPDATALYE